MPEHLKALTVILLLASVVFVFARGPACALGVSIEDYSRRRNLWFGITLTAFLSHNFWIFIVVAGLLLLTILPREPNKLAALYLLLFAVPVFSDAIGGLGIIKQFFTIDYIRLLALAVLVPAFLSLVKMPENEGFGRLLPDKLIIGYMVLQFGLTLSASTFTNTLRVGIFYSFIDIFLPYYVASRSLRNIEAFRDALMAFVIAAAVLALVGIFEANRHWLLYISLQSPFNMRISTINYLARGENLRAMGSAGHAIVMGYIMAVASGFLLYLKHSLPKWAIWVAGLVLLGGIMAPLSRGPWIGLAVILFAFSVTSPSFGKVIAWVAILGAIAVPVLVFSPVGKNIVAFLPFIGSVDADSLSYRQLLLQVGISVIVQNPLFGAYDYFYSAAMQELKQGEGIIDIVNTYLGVALGSGLVGLTLFMGFFIAVMTIVFRAMRKLADRTSELYVLGQVLFATLLGISIIIFTVSSISFIPVIYWSVAGIGIAYVRMLARAEATMETGPSGSLPAQPGFRPIRAPVFTD